MPLHIFRYSEDAFLRMLDNPSYTKMFKMFVCNCDTTQTRLEN